MCHFNIHSRMTDSFSMSLWSCSIVISIDTWSIFNQYQMHSRFQIVLIRIWFAFAMTLIRWYSTRNYDSRYHERDTHCVYIIIIMMMIITIDIFREFFIRAYSWHSLIDGAVLFGNFCSVCVAVLLLAIFSKPNQ